MSDRLHHRHVERLPRTALAAAFMRALRVWAPKHHGDAGTRIVIPAGVVTATELRQVVLALLAIQHHNKSTAARKAGA